MQCKLICFISKLKYYEKEKKCDVVPCYPDNELSIKKLVTNKLKGFEGVDTKVLNFLIENSNLNRFKINEELEKITSLRFEPQFLVSPIIQFPLSTVDYNST